MVQPFGGWELITGPAFRPLLVRLTVLGPDLAPPADPDPVLIEIPPPTDTHNRRPLLDPWWASIEHAMPVLPAAATPGDLITAAGVHHATIGLTIPYHDQLPAADFACELWAPAPDPAETGLWTYLVAPRLAAPDVELHYGRLRIYADTLLPNRWGRGPYPVESGPRGEPSTLRTPIEPDSHYRLQVVENPPPLTVSGHCF
ncbi:hypothetical protein ACFC1T_08910 [Kitasatospora sp. NPDC056076]|uniref:hypothetical protein n=1 Tax=Kitasatospora sp. NPDC056076 TaxID=3345703 RepID=UPI0035E38C3F